MLRAFAWTFAVLCSVPAFAAGYAVHGTYFDYGAAAPGIAPAVRRVPAVLYVSLRGREARLRLAAPGARCVPEFGRSRYVGPAHWGGPDDLAAHVEHKSECTHVSDDARLFLHFSRSVPRGVSTAILTDNLRGEGGPVLFQSN
jgi:hypothetical protein